jgi:hypothetical protein
MKTLLAIIIVSNFAVAAYSQTKTNASPLLTWKFQAPVDGSYERGWVYGLLSFESIEIDGNRFRYRIFSDSIGTRLPDYKGKIIQFPDHMWLSHRKVPDADRVSGLLTNHPVLWTYEAFEHWKKTGEIDPMGILYWNEPLLGRIPATNRSEMFRQVRAAVRDNR